jgi:hypothetical protein
MARTVSGCRPRCKQYWEEATKSKTWLAGQGVTFGQFSEADLAGFVRASTC